MLRGGGNRAVYVPNGGGWIEATRREVYRLLIAGYAQVDVARELKVSRKTIHTHTKALLKARHLVVLNPRGNPKQYGPGPVPIPDSEDPTIGYGEGGNRELPISLHHIKIYFPVISKPKIDLSTLVWDKIWSGSKSDTHYQRKIPRGNVPVDQSPVKSYTYHQGPDNESFQVNLEGIRAPIQEFREVYARRWAKAQEIANAFSKKAHVRFGLPREPEDPHAALPPPPGITDETLRRAKELNIRTDYASTEASDGPLEIEIQQLDLLNAYENLPNILKSLEAEDIKARSKLMEEAQKANIALQSISKMTKILHGHHTRLNLLTTLVAGDVLEETEEEAEDEPEGRYIG